MMQAADSDEEFDKLVLKLCNAGLHTIGERFRAVVACGSAIVPYILKVLENPTHLVEHALQPTAERYPNMGVESLTSITYSRAIFLTENLIRALAEIGDRRAVPTIIDLFQNPMGKIPSTRSEPINARSAFTTEGNIYFAAIRSLGELGDERAIPLLLSAMPGQSAHEWLILIDALANFKQVMDDESLVTGWLQELKNLISARDLDSGTALWTVGNIGTNEAISILIETMNESKPVPDIDWDTQPDIRISNIAAKVLERIGTPEALDAVRRWRENE